MKTLATILSMFIALSGLSQNNSGIGAKYEYSTLCLNYSSCYNMYQLMSDQLRLNKISSPKTAEVIRKFRSFLDLNIGQDGSISSLSVIIINLRDTIAFYKKSNDLNLSIVRIPSFSKLDLASIAIWLDSYNYVTVSMQRFSRAMDSTKIDLQMAYNELKNFESNDFVSENHKAVLGYSFTGFLSNRQSQLNELKNSDNSLYNEIIEKSNRIKTKTIVPLDFMEEERKLNLIKPTDIYQGQDPEISDDIKQAIKKFKNHDNVESQEILEKTVKENQAIILDSNALKTLRYRQYP